MAPEVNTDEQDGYMPYSLNATTLARSVTEKLSMLASDPLNYGTTCIYRVPEKYRKKKQEAYTPRLISVGPFHHEKGLQAVEYKLKYLNNFLMIFRVPIELLAEYVKSKEKLVWGCYENCYSLDSSKLPEMILLDGVFVVQLLLKNHFPEMREMGDSIFENPWVSNDILHDMILLENQLPMTFLRNLYNGFVYGKMIKFLDDNSVVPPSFDELAHEYLKNVGSTGKLKLTGAHRPAARHLVEFLANLHRPSRGREPSPPGAKFENIRSATELQQAGVKFRLGETKCLFDVEFLEGELRIPHLTVNDSTEAFFRNLIAYEHCGYQPKEITSYVILMDGLINTSEDVDLLIEHGIIRNFLTDSQQVADIFNSLYKEIVIDIKDFYFAELCIRLNKYSRDSWHKLKAKIFKWKVMLGREYFGNPWSGLSVAAAIFLLILTIIQTVCSILQV